MTLSNFDSISMTPHLLSAHKIYTMILYDLWCVVYGEWREHNKTTTSTFILSFIGLRVFRQQISDSSPKLPYSIEVTFTKC